MKMSQNETLVQLVLAKNIFFKYFIFICCKMQVNTYSLLNDSLARHRIYF